MSDSNTDSRTDQSDLFDKVPEETQNAVKDPSEWTTGGEPMTGPQASYLRTLLQQAGRSEDELDPETTKSAASEMIDELQKSTGRGTPDADRK